MFVYCKKELLLPFPKFGQERPLTNCGSLGKERQSLFLELGCGVPVLLYWEAVWYSFSNMSSLEMTVTLLEIKKYSVNTGQL